MCKGDEGVRNHEVSTVNLRTSELGIACVGMW